MEAGTGRICLRCSELLLRQRQHLDFVVHAVQDEREPSVDSAGSWVLVFEETYLAGVQTAVGEEVLVQV